MEVVIIIKGPTFFVQEDEERFFAWMYALPAFEEVIGSGRNLHIYLREPVDDETVRQLVTLCRRWCIDISPIRKLRSPTNDTFILWDSSLPDAVS